MNVREAISRCWYFDVTTKHCREPLTIAYKKRIDPDLTDEEAMECEPFENDADPYECCSAFDPV